MLPFLSFWNQGSSVTSRQACVLSCCDGRQTEGSLCSSSSAMVSLPPSAPVARERPRMGESLTRKVEALLLLLSEEVTREAREPRDCARFMTDTVRLRSGADWSFARLDCTWNRGLPTPPLPLPLPPLPFVLPARSLAAGLPSRGYSGWSSSNRPRKESRYTGQIEWFFWSSGCAGLYDHNR